VAAANAPAADAGSRSSSAGFDAALVAVVFVALLIRIFAARGKILWFDEFLSANLIRRAWSGLFPAIRAEAHPPFYFALLKLWCSIFGDGSLGMKSLSVLAGTSAVVVVADAVRRVRGEAAALAAAVLIGLSTVQIDQASEAKPYALLAFFVALLIWSVVRDRERRSVGSLASVLAVGAACASTHFYGGACTVALALCAIISAGDRRARVGASALFVTGLIVSAIWLPGAFRMDPRAADYIRQMWGGVPGWAPFLASTRVALPGWRKPYPTMAGTILPDLAPREIAAAAAVVLIGIVALIGARAHDDRPAHGRFLTLAALNRPIALIGRSEVIVEIGFAILMAVAISRWRRFRGIPVVVVAILGLGTVIPQWRPHAGRLPIRWEEEIVHRLRAVSPPGAHVDIVTLGLGRPPFEYFAHGDPRLTFISFPLSQNDHPGWAPHSIDTAEARALAQEAVALVAAIDDEIARGVSVYLVDRADPRNAYLLSVLRRDHDLRRVPWGASWFYAIVRAPVVAA